MQRATALQEVAAQASGIGEHAIVCGYGRTGQSIARFLAREKIPFIALDTDAHRVQQAVQAGESVVFGDADRREVLVAAGLDRARVVIVTYADRAFGDQGAGHRASAPAGPAGGGARRRRQPSR
ncbi:MAG: NAD-binding protein [Rhodocyclaceae bacterium]|nr:NAD-binding protein [Rhodocyclaceae bacterium]